MKALIVGFGSSGKKHAGILAGKNAVETVELVTQQKTSTYATYSDLEHVPDLQSFDYFVIASETHAHYRNLCYLEESVSDKTILVEKPLFDRFYSFSAEKNRIFVAYNLRFHPILQKLREWVASSRVLSVAAIVGQYLPAWRPSRDYRLGYSASAERGGGVLLDLSHEIDYIQWLFGDMAVKSAVSRKISDLEIDSDDYLALIGRTSRGTYVSLSMDYLSQIPIREILVHTDGMTLKVDLIRSYIQRKSIASDSECYSRTDLERNFAAASMHEALLNRDYSDICHWTTALSTMKVVDEIRTIAD